MSQVIMNMDPWNREWGIFHCHHEWYILHLEPIVALQPLIGNFEDIFNIACVSLEVRA